MEAFGVSVGQCSKKSIRKQGSDLGISRLLRKVFTSTLSADLAFNFLPLDGFSDFLLHLFSCYFQFSSTGLKVRIPQEYLGFSTIRVKINVSAETCLNSLIGFRLYVSLGAKKKKKRSKFQAMAFLINNCYL